jgi:carbamoyltransferase
MKCLSGTINFPINVLKFNACSPFLKNSAIDSFIQNFIKSEKEGSFTVIKKIIGRFVGKSEWEAIALGNRSILCDPRFKENIDLINQKIKSRDYWMPFALSIICEDVDLYFNNKKNINSDFMQTSFDATDFAKKNIPAAINPVYFTLRPQVVRKEININFYNLFDQFKRLTGVGCLLNTSFNLHGNPNVETPENAFYTFVNSGLDVLNIENYIFYKNNFKK